MGINQLVHKYAVFRIHDILVWIRIRGFMPLNPDPDIFVIVLQDANKKLIKKKCFSAYYFLRVLLHNFSKVKSQKEVTKQLTSRFFLLFLLDDN
jgi:hypothetical protein